MRVEYAPDGVKSWKVFWMKDRWSRNREQEKCSATSLGRASGRLKGTASWLLRSGGTWSGQKESASGAVGGTPGGRKKGTFAGHFLGVNKQSV